MTRQSSSLSMTKRFQRWMRRLRASIRQSLSLTTRSHGQYFITVFVFCGIGVFAALHAIISMMITNIEYKQTGYLDLYLENTNICWKNESIKGNAHPSWNSYLLSVDCNRFKTIQHVKKYISENGQKWALQEGHFPIFENSSISASGSPFRSIRNQPRLIFHGNCSHLLIAPSSSSQREKPLFDAGSCYSFSEDSTSHRFSLSSLSGAAMSSSIRCLPSFLIIGAMKSGTGEIMKWLNLHPFLKVGNGFEYQQNYLRGERKTGFSSEVNPLVENSNIKEVHFFSKYLASHTTHRSDLHHHHKLQHHYRHQTAPVTNASSEISRDLSRLSPLEKWSILHEYLHYFPILSDVDSQSIYTFEKSPDYIRNPTILSMIAQLLPSVKLILQLRNPAIRAISEFQHHCRKKRFIKLLKDVTVNNQTYPKGSVLKNANFLKDYHQLNGIEMEFVTSDDSPHSSSPSPSLHHHYRDRFTVNAKDFPIHAFISLPYPCSAGDMMTYFTQFDPSISRTSGSPPRSNRITGSSVANTTSISSSPTPSSSVTNDLQRADNGKSRKSSHRRVLRSNQTVKTSETLRNNPNKSPTPSPVVALTVKSKSKPPIPNPTPRPTNLFFSRTNSSSQRLEATNKQNLSSSSSLETASTTKSNRDRVKSEPLLRPMMIPAVQHSIYPKEIFNGYYYNQLYYLFQLFPPENVLLLLQEEMYQNTFRTLRSIESFLSLPCYDYSQVAIVIDAHHPPERKPSGVIDKIRRYRRGIRKVFGLDQYKQQHIGGKELFEAASPQFQAWINNIYRENNRRLLELFQHYYLQKTDSVGDNTTDKDRGDEGFAIREAGWSL